MWQKQTFQVIVPALLGAYLAQPISSIAGHTASYAASTMLGAVKAVMPRWEPSDMASMTEAWDPSNYIDACPEQQYTIRIVSYQPLLVNIQNFVTPEEGEYLISLAQVTPIYLQPQPS
jgi:hypothetical protein